MRSTAESVCHFCVCSFINNHTIIVHNICWYRFHFKFMQFLPYQMRQHPTLCRTSLCLEKTMTWTINTHRATPPECRYATLDFRWFAVNFFSDRDHFLGPVQQKLIDLRRLQMMQEATSTFENEKKWNWSFAEAVNRILTESASAWLHRILISR